MLERSNNEIHLVALPKGSTDRMDEKPMTSFSLTREEVDKVKTAASKEGWHGFRTVVDDHAVPNFVRALNV